MFMFITLFYILESNIKKYKDEKSLQETGIVLLINDNVLRIKYLLMYYFLKLQLNLIFFIHSKKFIMYYICLIYIRVVICFFLIIINNYFEIHQFLQDVYLVLLGNGICYCMEEQQNIQDFLPMSDNSVSSIASESELEGSDSDMELEDMVRSLIWRNRDEIDIRHTLSQPNRSQFLHYYIGAPYTRVNLSGSNPLLESLLNEGADSLLDVQNVLFNIRPNIVSVNELEGDFLSGRNYLNLFRDINHNITKILYLKNKCFLKTIEPYLLKAYVSDLVEKIFLIRSNLPYGAILNIDSFLYTPVYDEDLCVFIERFLDEDSMLRDIFNTINTNIQILNTRELVPDLLEPINQQRSDQLNLSFEIDMNIPDRDLTMGRLVANSLNYFRNNYNHYNHDAFLIDLYTFDNGANISEDTRMVLNSNSIEIRNNR